MTIRKMDWWRLCITSILMFQTGGHALAWVHRPNIHEAELERQVSRDSTGNPPSQTDIERAQETLTQILHLMDSIKYRHQQRQDGINHQLMVALMRNYAGRAIALIAQGADPNTRYVPPASNRAVTPYASPPFNATQHGLTMIRVLKPLPIDTNLTALMIACRVSWNQGTTWRWNLEGASCEVPERQGDDTRLIEAMLLHGANVNATDEHGRTALMWAVYANRLKAVRLLLEHGANVNMQTDEGRTVLHDLVKAEVFDRIGVDLRTELNSFNVQGSIFIKAGWTPQLWYGPMLHLLVAYGADLNIADKQGKTPLSEAAKTPSPTVVALLQQFGRRK